MIAPEGKVAGAVVKDNSMQGGLDVANCMTRAFERWKFPKPRAGQVTVTSPFELEPGHISE
ncbi:hypothetical protein DB30_04701 [Enhygromyxa salina]|uniref:TonB C-terminal domain-containing protein n=1 Tax=Enhygromyxa salina TaxID=215803 RepID=A0A0C2D802_9BACT|nr:hypothetical protein DB30_04701 [Enhygromyxa salina]